MAMHETRVVSPPMNRVCETMNFQLLSKMTCLGVRASIPVWCHKGVNAYSNVVQHELLRITLLYKTNGQFILMVPIL